VSARSGAAFALLFEVLIVVGDFLDELTSAFTMPIELDRLRPPTDADVSSGKTGQAAQAEVNDGE
jgi:hypothetical protein